MPVSLSKVRVEFDERGLQQLRAHPAIRDEFLRLATQGIARPAAAAAPHRTGAGAASIHAAAVLDFDEWVVRVSWDEAHYYMGFHELGTRYMDADPFLRPATEAFR